MQCPQCGSKTRVTTTCNEFSDHIRRYRKCTVCSHKFVTRQGLEEITAANPRPYQVFSAEDVDKMRDLFFDDGRSSREVAEIYGCSISWVNKIMKGKAWANV